MPKPPRPAASEVLRHNLLILVGLSLLTQGLKPLTDVACDLLAIDLRLDIPNDCEGLQQEFQHAEYFTCDPVITQPIFIGISNSFHKLSNNSSYNMMRRLFLVAIASNSLQINHRRCTIARTLHEI